MIDKIFVNRNYNGSMCLGSNIYKYKYIYINEKGEGKDSSDIA